MVNYGIAAALVCAGSPFTKVVIGLRLHTTSSMRKYKCVRARMRKHVRLAATSHTCHMIDLAHCTILEALFSPCS